MPPPVALSIAGSDSSGGAGIQADLKTFMALGVHGATAITALTAQNSRGVSSVHPIPPSFVREQISQVVEDAGVAAAKTGMLWSAAIIEAVADSILEARIEKLVVDPVLVSTSKAALLESDALRFLKQRLLPLAAVATPNLYEASALSGAGVETMAEMKYAAECIKDMGPAWVLVKGGHLRDDPVDLLFDGSSFLELPGARVPSGRTHGSGCVLAAAICAWLALGCDIETAAWLSKKFVSGAIEGGFQIGAGAGSVNPAWDLSPREPH